MSHGTGPDDLLARQGASAIQQIVARAVPADPEMRVQDILASGQDIPRLLAELLDDKPFMQSVCEHGAGKRMKVEEVYKKYRAKSNFDKALKQSERDRRTQSSASNNEIQAPIYAMVDGVLCLKGSQGGWQALSNFDARIVAQRVLDDGDEQHRVFEIEGTLQDGTKLARIRVSPEEFAETSWWTVKWGARAIVTAGAGFPAHLRAAIQKLSEPTEHRSYGYTGWCTVDGQTVFLHGAGAVGASGVSVELDGPLARVVLPEFPYDLPGAVKVALRILEMAPEPVSFPLLLSAFRAPLMDVLKVDGIVHLFGRTGSFKSSTAALVQCFFGATFVDNSGPASFTDTFASIENKLYRLKDSVATIDEFVPRSSDPNDETRKKAAQVIRMIGNGAPRARMRADLTARPSRSPRALVLTTGEEMPDGESIVARVLAIEFSPGLINKQVLTELQSQASRLSHAMSGYITFLAPRLEALRLWAPDRHRELRTLFSRQGGHLRAPSLAAHLALAADLFAEYALSIGAVDETAARSLVARAHSALEEALTHQNKETRQENPVQRFLSLLIELLQTGGATVLPSPELAPNRERDVFPVLGCRSDAELRLLPETTYTAIAEFARRQGRPLSVSPQALWRALRDDGVITPPEKNRSGVKRKVFGKTTRVLVLRESALLVTEEDAPSQPKVGDPAVTPEQPNDEDEKEPMSEGDEREPHGPSQAPRRRASQL